MAKFYCLYCGVERSNVASLTSAICSKNPTGKFHVLYEGSEKSKYTCKYCGIQRSDISGLTSAVCNKNPNGKYHLPAL